MLKELLDLLAQSYIADLPQQSQLPALEDYKTGQGHLIHCLFQRLDAGASAEQLRADLEELL